MRAWVNLVGWLLLAALLALLGVWLGRDPGQVQIRWLGQQIDTSMAFLIVAAVVLVLLLWVLDGVLRRFPRSWRQRRTERLRATFRRGWTCLAEGRSVIARRLLLKASTLPEQRSLALYGAAVAAADSGDAVQADELLGGLGRTTLSSAARAAYARRQLDAGHGQAAEVALSDLAVPAERLAWLAALQMQGRAAEALAAWPAVLELKLPGKAKLSTLQQALIARACAEATTRDQLQGIWSTLDRTARELPGSVQAFATAALRLEAGELALEPVQAALAQGPDDGLFALYGRLPHADLRAALKRLENWHETLPASSALTLALAQLCRRLALWGKAYEVVSEGLARDNRAAALWEELGVWASAQAELKMASQALQNALRCTRGEPLLVLDAISRSTTAALPVATLPASAHDARGVYGFPLPPGG